MRKLFLFVLLSAGVYIHSKAQSTYSIGNFANSGDTFYYTKAQSSLLKFDTSGANITWNYASLTGISQQQLVYRLPTQTGYSALQWPYLYNSNNVNLSSSDGQTKAILGFQQSNSNDYYLKSNNYLREKASAYTLTVGGFAYNVRNVYDQPDTLYKFPLQYNGTGRSASAYTVNIPGVYYRYTTISRRDTIKGWGTIITPYKTYSNALQLVSTVVQTDSLSVAGQAIPLADTTEYREIKWFDPSEKNCVMNVRQTKTGFVYVTTEVVYLDHQQYYQPEALFAYVPVQPNMGDTVIFQNLSTNATAYKWNFGDGSDSSTVINPQHIFAQAGTYPVKLIAYNGALSDTLIVSVRINPVNQTYIFTGNGNWTDAANWQNNVAPPDILPAGNTIIINHITGGACILNTSQTLNSGASLMINTGMNLVVPGNIRIQ